MRDARDQSLTIVQSMAWRCRHGDGQQATRASLPQSPEAIMCQRTPITSPSKPDHNVTHHTGNRQRGSLPPRSTPVHSCSRRASNTICSGVLVHPRCCCCDGCARHLRLLEQRAAPRYPTAEPAGTCCHRRQSIPCDVTLESVTKAT